MHHPFWRIFPNQGHENWVRRRRLKKSNPYNLPAGDYIFLDLYPVLPEDPSSVFLLIQHVRTGTHLATLELSWSPQQVELNLNPAYLQSPIAPQVFEMVRDTLDQEPALQDTLWERLQAVGLMLREVNQDIPESSLLSEMAIRALAGVVDTLMQESHPSQWEAHLDYLLANLRQALLAAMQQHRVDQNKVISLAAVRQQKAAQEEPEIPS